MPRALILVGLVAAALLGGCGTEPGPSASPSPTAGSSSLVLTDPGPAELTIKASDSGGAMSTWTLTCAPAGGNHPDPEAACQVLAEHGTESLPAVGKNRMCTEVYGGAETATITGTWRGESVDSRMARNNGCEISRWESLTGLLPAPS